MQRRLVRLGTSEVAVAYPAALAPWFDGFEKAGRCKPAKWVRIAPSEADRFSVSTSLDAPVGGLTLGDALATLWERVAFLLVDDLRDALAVHAAALTNDKGLVLIPGASGAGKTSLSLWYRQAGFDLNTDEVFCASLEPLGRAERPCRSNPGPAPFHQARKRRRRAAAKRRDGARGNLIGRARRQARDARTTIAVSRRSALIVFPRYKANAPISLKPLTTAQSGFRLLENCVKPATWRAAAFRWRALSRVRHARSRGIRRDGPANRNVGRADRARLLRVTHAKSFADLCSVLSASAAARAAGPRITNRTVENPAPAVVEAPTVKRSSRRLTIGMATYDDYDGVYFTIQSLRTQNPDIENAIEFLVVDNNPDGRCSAALKNRQLDRRISLPASRGLERNSGARPRFR